MFSGLPAAELRLIDEMCHSYSYPAGGSISQEQDELDYIGFVEEGILRLRKSLPGGREHIVGLLAKGDMFGRVFDGPMDYAIEAATAAKVARFPRHEFEDLVTRVPELERVVVLNILNELDAAREWTLILANHRTSERLAGFLLVLCRRWAKVNRAKRDGKNGGSVVVRVPISRSDVAHLLGARPESISRAFRTLADNGYIRPITAYDIEILDFGALISHSSMKELEADPLIAGLRAPKA